ncbi:MAG: cobalt-precorrin-6A reductase [Paracoccaceae bacterium]|nr:cobalt-precorrin-6A reductase [Paracoccaceae bacterium]
MTRVLLLGGTTEASQLARTLAAVGMDAVFSYAGRTDAPMTQPLATRVGGFGGVAGLVNYLKAEGITHIVDATHPFAAGMSRNAVAAATQARVHLVALERPAWEPDPVDRWTQVADVPAAVAALPHNATRIFLAIGRKHLAEFSSKPQHYYLARLVDCPRLPLPLRHVEAVIARGPFDCSGDLALMRKHGIELLVAKNGGGVAARAKIDAARELGLPVVMIERPSVPDRLVLGTTAAVMDWITHSACLGV